MHTYSWHGSVIGIELHIESHRCVGEWIICIFLCPQYKINLFHLLVQLGSFEQSNDAINEHQSTSTYYRFHFATIQKFGVFRKIRCDRTQRTNNTPVQCQLTMRTHSKNINIFGFIERDVSVHWNYPCADVKHSWWGSQRIPSTNTRTLAHTRCLSHWDSWALDVFSYEDKLVKRWVWNECAHALGAKCCEYRVDVEGALEHPKYLHLLFFLCVRYVSLLLSIFELLSNVHTVPWIATYTILCIIVLFYVYFQWTFYCSDLPTVVGHYIFSVFAC